MTDDTKMFALFFDFDQADNASEQVKEDNFDTEDNEAEEIRNYAEASGMGWWVRDDGEEALATLEVGEYTVDDDGDYWLRIS